MANTSVLINGSARGDGNTKMICKYVSQISSAPIFDLNDFNIGYYTYDHSNSSDDFFPLMEKIITFDTLVFATPVYWYSMSAQMKTFLDRFTDLLKIKKDLGRQLRGKNMKVICCSSGEEEYPEFWKPFERSAEYLGMQYLGHSHTWIEPDEIPLEVKNRLKDLFG
ncbi:MAG: multimeric flavodoxin WrbA [Saprospiraceae bacterium]|jgi:multimeric flavodoxin WrbA